MIWIIAALAVLLVIVAWLWWLSLRQMNGMTNFLLLTLLSEENYQKHRGSLHSLINDLSASNAPELAMKITLMVRKLVGKADPQRMSEAVITTMWERRKGGGK